MRSRKVLFGGSRKPRCQKGKPCGDVCIPRRSKCDDQASRTVSSKKEKSSKKNTSANLFEEKKYQSELYRRGFLGGGLAVSAIVAGAGIQIAHDLKKIQPDPSRPDPPPDYESLTPGDLVRRKTVLGGVTAYHYAVYAGKDEKSGEHYVVHTQLSGKKNQEAGSVVVRTPIENDKEPFFRVPEEEMYKKEEARKISKEEALARAEKMIGKSYTYTFFSSNCESFARAVVEGAAYTAQGESVSPLTRNLLDFFTQAAFAASKKQYLQSKNRMNSKEILDYLDSRRAAFRRDSASAEGGGLLSTKMKHDLLNTLEFRGVSTPPSNPVDAFCDQIGMKRPDDYYALSETLSAPLGTTRRAVKLKMITDYTKMIMGVINSDGLMDGRADSFDRQSRGGRHPPPLNLNNTTSFYRKIRLDSLLMSKSIASLSPEEIAREISSSHGIRVDDIYEAEVRNDGSLSGVACSGGDFFEFDINSRSVGVVERPDLTRLMNERSRGVLAAAGVEYRGDSAFEYLRGLEARLDAPFGARGNGQCGRGWEPGPGGKCIRSRGGGMGRGAKIGAGVAGVAALGGAAALGRKMMNKKPAQKSLPSASGGAIVPYSATAWKNSSSGGGSKPSSPSSGRLRQGLGKVRSAASGVVGKARGAVSSARNMVGGFRAGMQAGRGLKKNPPPAPRRENPSGAITVSSRRVDGLARLDAPFGRKMRNGKCGRGWEPGPGGKCIRSRGGGMGRGAKIGAGVAGVAALGGAAALGRKMMNKKPAQKSLPSASGGAIVPYSATAWKNSSSGGGSKPSSPSSGRLRQGLGKVRSAASGVSPAPKKGGKIRQGVGVLKEKAQKFKDGLRMTQLKAKKMPGTSSTISSYQAPRN